MRVQSLKEIGDMSLDSSPRASILNLVDIDYYMGIGVTASHLFKSAKITKA